MDPSMLTGIGSSRPSPIRPSTPSKREDSIELEDHSPDTQEQFTRLSKQRLITRDMSPKPYNPAKSPLLPLDHEHGPVSPTKRLDTPPAVDSPPLMSSRPSSPSTESVFDPLAVYLNTEDKHESLKIRLDTTSLEQTSPPTTDTSTPIVMAPLAQSFCGSTWQVVDKSDSEPSIVSYPASTKKSLDKADPSTPPPPLLQPLKSPKVSSGVLFEAPSSLSEIVPGPGPSPESGSSDSAISDLSLSGYPALKRARDSSESPTAERLGYFRRARDRPTNSCTTLRSIRRRIRDKDSPGNGAH